MKAFTKKLTITIITLMISGTLLLANTTDVYVHVLNNNEWETIEETAEMEAILDIKEIPTIITAQYTVLSSQDWSAIEREVENEALFNQQRSTLRPDFNFPTLTEADWIEISEAAELDAMLDF
jgi:hypothetical protein